MASLTLGFLYPNGQYDDTANEIATVKAVSDGVTYTYSLTATGWYTADWSGSGSVDNVAQAITGDDGMWELTDPFGDLAVDSIILTVLGTSTRCPSTDNNYDFSFYAMSTTNATPIPGAVWLLGAGLLGLVGYRKKIRGLVQPHRNKWLTLIPGPGDRPREKRRQNHTFGRYRNDPRRPYLPNQGRTKTERQRREEP